MTNWQTNTVALLIIAALIAKWWQEKRVDLTDFQNIIGLLAAIGFIAAKDGGAK